VKSQLTDIFFLWKEASGEEWTVGRFKSIKTDLLQWKASGRKPETPWVKRTSAGNFKGLFGVLQRLMLTPQFLNVLRLMNIYTSLVSQRVTKIQLKKFLDSMLAKGRKGDVSYYISLINKLPPIPIPEVGLPTPLATVGPLRPAHEQRALREIVDRPYDLIDWVDHRILLKEFFRGILPFDGLIAALQAQLDDAPLSAHWKAVVGHINVTQEPGFKARFYADPFIWIQRVLDPLKDSLMQNLTKYPWDCTFDQRKADERIVASLNQKETVYCFDLSDATNLFPLSIQAFVLERSYKGTPYMLPFFFDACNSYWKMHDQVLRKFGRGQALGLGPSFPLFAWSHGLLLRALLGRKWKKDFYIIGDDVVILNPNLAKRYSKALEDLDVDWSPSKTLQSDVIAEFGGALYTRDGLLWNPKWIPLRRDNVLDVVSWWGLRFLECVCPVQIRGLVSQVLALPEPWGIGLNPKGLPLSERLTPHLLRRLLEEREDLNVGYLLDTRKRLSALLRFVPEKDLMRFSHSIPELNSILDLTEQERVDSTPFSGWKIPSSLLEVNSFLSNDSLPLPRGNVSRWKDPYTLGPLSRWKRLFRESERDLQPATVT
jgi:hypothetical protein